MWLKTIRSPSVALNIIQSPATWDIPAKSRKGQVATDINQKQSAQTDQNYASNILSNIHGQNKLLGEEAVRIELIMQSSKSPDVSTKFFVSPVEAGGVG